MAASQKLSHLLQLADQGPTLRAALAEEVAELLASWPSDYPESMRPVCEALLAKAAHDLDAATRARVQQILSSHPELSRRLLPCGLEPVIAAARAGGNAASALAQSLGVGGGRAQQILADESGAMLAVACKGAGFDRAAFSALALLTHPSHDRGHAFALLDAFDTITVSEAVYTLNRWRQGQVAA
jgi:hypothetical protein